VRDLGIREVLCARAPLGSEPMSSG